MTINNLQPSAGFENLCINAEGEYLEAYPDPASPLGKACTRAGLHVSKYKQYNNWASLKGAPWTIGIGHTGSVDGKPVTPGMVITREKSRALLKADAAIATSAVNKLVSAKLNQNQFDALVDFTFNLGQGNLQSSTLLRKLNADDYAGAANEFPRWNKAGGVVLNGLVKRRADERKLFLS